VVAFLMLFAVGWLLDRVKTDKNQGEKPPQAAALQNPFQPAAGGVEFQ